MSGEDIMVILLSGIVLSGIVLMVVGIFFIATPQDLSISQRLKDRRIRKQDEGQPTYEKLARAYERKADDLIKRGWTDRARVKLREAQRIRSEATEAMMRGEQPPL